MKLKNWFLSAVFAGGAIVASAQTTNLSSPPPLAPAPTDSTVAPAPETKPAPAKHKAKKTHTKKPVAAPAKKDVGMKYDPPVEGVAKDAVVNVRGQPNFVGEVVGHLKKGETVTVYETLEINTHGKDEPSKWDRVDLPTNRLVWVDGLFIDKTNGTVKAKKLNVRGGPGENFSVVGHLEKGDVITVVKKEKGWIGMAPPTNSFGYIAAECLTLGPAPAPVAVAPAPIPPPTPAPVVVQTPVEAPPPAPAQPEPAAPAPTAASQSEQELAALHKAEAVPPSPPPGNPAAAPTELPAEVPPRIITREGFVRRAYNVQAPTDFELGDIKTGEAIDFLQPSANQNFKMYVGTRITVTGAEVMDQRWPRTPILKVQTVDLMP